MAAEFTVLFSSAGRRVALIEAFRADAKALGLELNVIAVDADPEWSAACEVADRSFKVPRADSPIFSAALKKICLNENVRLVVPTIDHELLPLAESREEFTKAGIHVAVSSPELIRIARDKVQTAEHLRAKRVLTPRTARVADVLQTATKQNYPLILKPISGSGSAHVQRIAHSDELLAFAGVRPDYIVQQYITGREFTVHQYYDRAGKLRCTVPHLRKEVRAGEVSKGTTDRHPLLMDLSERLAAALPPASGPICFQAIIEEGLRAYVIDINARFGGGFPLAHRAGASFPRWLMQEALGQEPDAHDKWQHGITMLRYDAAVFSGERIDHHHHA